MNSGAVNCFDASSLLPVAKGDSDEIRNRILLIKSETGKSFSEMSTAAGLTRVHLYQFMSGRIQSLTTANLDRLADAIGVRRPWLSSGEGPMRAALERYAALPAVRAMALASGFSHTQVHSWEVKLELKREPSPDELWGLFKVSHEMKLLTDDDVEEIRALNKAHTIPRAKR
jgi:transcriptional regulator with XRE-family HTH domain